MPGLTAPQSSNHPTSRREAWERWVIIWNVVFYLTLILPTALVLISKNYKGSPALIFGLSLVQGIWYGLIIVWLVPRFRGKQLTLGSLVYLAVAIAGWVPLARAHPAYYLIASSFYGLMWGLLPFGWAVVGNVILTGLILWMQVLNSSHPIILSGNMLLIGSIIIAWSSLIALWFRSIMRESAERKRLIEQLETVQRNLAESERKAGILQERQRMAQEIHDTLAQDFTSIVMQLEVAEQALPIDLKAAWEHIQKSREMARAGLAEARRLVQALQPEALEKASLPDAMKRVADRWAEETAIRLIFLVTGNFRSLHPEIEVTLLRAMQEALANIHKHAQAQQVSITLSYMDDGVILDINDDGIGFSPENLIRLPRGTQGGYGLNAMRKRAAQLGGSLIVESSPGKGTTLAIQIPLRKESSFITKNQE